MRRLFISPGRLHESEIVLGGPDFHHLAQVLRVRPGEPLLLLDGEGQARNAVISSVSRRELTVQIVGPAPVPASPLMHVTVAQAVGKGDRFEQVIQHATEVGASAFVPLTTTRTVVRLDSRTISEKLSRWTAIAKGAAEQSARERIPEVLAPVSVADLLPSVDRYKLSILLDVMGEALGSVLRARSLMEQSPCLLMVGPEGGFTPEEIGAARAAGVTIASLGTYILRTETAAVAALSQLNAIAQLQAER